jgi:hypothetical protein
MFMTLFVVLLVLWLLGFFAFHVGSGLIHILLIIAVIALVVHFVRGRGSAYSRAPFALWLATVQLVTGARTSRIRPFTASRESPDDRVAYHNAERSLLCHANGRLWVSCPTLDLISLPSPARR